MRLRHVGLLAFSVGLLVSITPAIASGHPAPTQMAPRTILAAQEESNGSIAAVFEDRRGVGRGEDGTPIQGVVMTVTDENGTLIGRGESDENGEVEIPIPGLGEYVVEVERSTLPPDAEIRGEGGTTRTITVNLDGQRNVVQFQIGDPPAPPPSLIQRLLNAALVGVKFGLIIGLAALGLSMIFGTTGLTNFAHGELITFGALSTYLLNRGMGLPVEVAGAGAIVLGMLFGWAQDRGLWRPLRHRGTGLIAMMIVSIGFSILLRYLFQYGFGGSTRPLSAYVQQDRLRFGPFTIAPKEIAIIVIAALAITIVCLALAKTRLGKATRAVADNPALAASSGLKVDSVVSAVWIVGVGLTGLAGALLAVDQQVNFRMGFNLLLLVFAAVCLGGLGTVWGALVGSLIIGVLVEVSPVLGMPPELKAVGALVALIVILLVRPQGLLGRRERIG